jgi:hypothetical protein
MSYRRTCQALTASVLATALVALPLTAQEESSEETPTIESKTEGFQKIDGFVPVYFSEDDGKIWLEISRWNEEFLHYTSLPAGMGQNSLGLNRGDLGARHVVVFKRVGPKVLMEEPNYGYRAISDDPLERKSVDDGFPTSVLWGFTVSAETDDRVLVDATSFFMSDWHRMASRLQSGGQGTFRLEATRSAIFMPRTKGFPDNSEVEVMLTFTSDRPGGLVSSVSPTATSFTVRQHHSFVRLPALDGSFVPRKADPRAGYNGVTFMDFALPIDQDLEVRYIARHRMEKRNPGSAPSEPVEPIVYYLDPGTPEPVRSALLEGGQLWNQAFEAAGFINGFRMEVLPADADPMDVRYNVVQWVHRSTRGWSYGNSISDPRTGEILKGHVTLGSLRVRQDYLIGEGLTAPYVDGDEDASAAREMAVQRIRQLSAHEIGHTLGLSHNYIASAQTADGTQSVMDYPHPVIGMEDGRVSLGPQSYANEIGAWDKIAIAYGYTDFPDGTDEDAALDAIIQAGLSDGISFISDQDARPAGSAHPKVHLWDNGATAAGELNRMMDVRRVALDHFGETAIKTGEPMATMEDALVPLFLHHRYQAEATTKVVGGQYYTYAMRGDGQEPLRSVPAAEQHEALDALMRTLHPSELTIPRNVLDNLPPRPFRYGPHQELFRRHTGLVFDAVAPATAAADATLGFLFQPERAARMVQQAALDPSLPGLDEVIARVSDETFSLEPADAYEAEINRAVERVLVEKLMSLAATSPVSQVRAIAHYSLSELAVSVTQRSDDVEDLERAHYRLLASDIGRFMERDYESGSTGTALAMPPGSPIGDPGMDWLGGSDWSMQPITAADASQLLLTCPWSW